MIKALLALIVSIVSLPLIGILMLFDFSPAIPLDAYEYLPSDTMVATRLQTTLTTLQAGQLVVELDETFINQLLYSYFVEQINPDYAPGAACNTVACEFLVSNSDIEIGTVGITGIWVRLFDDVVSINVGLRTLGIPFQTRVRLDFEVIDNAEVFEIKYSRLQLGNIPLPAFVIRPIIDAVLTQSNVSQTNFAGNGVTLNVDALTLVIDKSELIEQSLEESAALFATLIVDEELVRFAVEASPSRIMLFVDLDKLTSNLTLKQYSGRAESVFAELFIAVSSGIDFNRNDGVFLTTKEYFLSEQDVSVVLGEQFQGVNIGDLFGVPAASAVLELKPLWVELEGTSMTLVLPLTLMEQLIPIEFVMTSLPSTRDLLLQVESITIGRDDNKSSEQYVLIQGNQVQEFLAVLSIDGLFEVQPNSRIIKVSADYFDQAVREVSSELRVTRVSIVDGQLRLNLELA